MRINRGTLVSLWAIAIAIATVAGALVERGIMWAGFLCLGLAVVIVVGGIYLKFSQTWHSTVEEGRDFTTHLARIIVLLIRTPDIGPKQVKEMEEAGNKLEQDWNRAVKLFGGEEAEDQRGEDREPLNTVETTERGLRSIADGYALAHSVSEQCLTGQVTSARDSRQLGYVVVGQFRE